MDHYSAPIVGLLSPATRLPPLLIPGLDYLEPQAMSGKPHSANQTPIPRELAYPKHHMKSPIPRHPFNIIAADPDGPRTLSRWILIDMTRRILPV